MKLSTTFATLVATSAISLLSTSANAALTLLENFDNLNTGALSGQNGWTANANTTVVLDSGIDQVANLAVSASGNLANYKALGDLRIGNSNTASTVYFNFTLESTAGNNFNFILSDVTAPGDTAGSSEVQLNTDGSAPTGGVPTFRVNNGGTFIHLSTVGGSGASAIPLIADSQYNVWLTIDNSTDTYQVFMQNSGIPSIADGPTQLFHAGGTGTGDFRFRNSGTNLQANDLVTFNFGSGGTGSAVVQVDDIYVDTTGKNLVNPVPEPSALTLALIGLAGLGMRRRRQNSSR